MTKNHFVNRSQSNAWVVLWEFSRDYANERFHNNRKTALYSAGIAIAGPFLYNNCTLVWSYQPDNCHFCFFFFHEMNSFNRIFQIWYWDQYLPRVAWVFIFPHPP